MKGAAVAIIAAMLCACDRGDQQIKVYRIAKAPLESTPPPEATMPTNASSPAADAMVAPPSSEKPQIQWDVPSGWSSAPASAMRYASFAAESNGEKADISIVTFPGDGGSDADNVNRWRQQIGLGPVDSVDALIAPQHAGALHFSTVDMAGPTARVLAGWTRHEGRAWFFKLTGPPAVVEQEKPRFEKFLQSVRF
ncbi:MAG: hypothetical protein QOE26_3102 [Verrucomicrobiota bacterium]|jgi:hypothetical protein